MDVVRLPPDVVNQIAAGEVIHRPASAVKELLENAVDAGATSITIKVAQGGAKLLAITDNGHGIRREDLGIVCERFTTSKLKTFEDLQTIGTYGFRGEALASITHVAHVSILSKTAEQECAFKASYSNGALVPVQPGGAKEPKPSAGVVGTTITVEDLFYNMPARKRAISKAGEEYSRILDVVSGYAVHKSLWEDDIAFNEANKGSTAFTPRAGVGMVCKKQKSAAPDLRTSSSDSKLDAIRSAFGSLVAKELVYVEESGTCSEEAQENVDGNKASQTLDKSWACRGYVSNANYNRKKHTAIFFINERMVSCASLRKCLDAAYAEFLPKGTHPFVYLALSLPPETVDVNVHPTKQQVHFLNEDVVVAQIVEAVRRKLANANESRAFYAQQTLTHSFGTETMGNNAEPSNSSPPAEKDDGNSTTQSSDWDAQARLEAPATRQDEIALEGGQMGSSSNVFASLESRFPGAKNPALKKRPLDEPRTAASFSSSQRKRKYTPSKMVRTDPTNRGLESFFSSTPSQLESVSQKSDDLTPEICEEALQLSSVQGLIKEFKEDQSEKVLKMLRAMVFVGWIDDCYCLVQIQTKLFLMDYAEISRHLFYQNTLLNFGQLRRIRLERPISIRQLLELGIKHQQSRRAQQGEDGPREKRALSEVSVTEKIEKMVQVLCDADRSEMLDEYFRIGIDPREKTIYALPEILRGHAPCIGALPRFVLRLGEVVPWYDEKLCFDAISWDLADMYIQTMPPSNEDEWDHSEANPRNRVFKDIIFPSLRRNLSPPSAFLRENEGILVQVAALEKLYRIFERC